MITGDTAGLLARSGGWWEQTTVRRRPSDSLIQSAIGRSICAKITGGVCWANSPVSVEAGVVAALAIGAQVVLAAPASDCR